MALAARDPRRSQSAAVDLAMTLALGRDACPDIAAVRAEPEGFGPGAPDPTASRVVAAPAADGEKVLVTIITARASAHPLVIDIDATLATPHSEKENARPTPESDITTAPARHPAWNRRPAPAGGPVTPTGQDRPRTRPPSRARSSRHSPTKERGESGTTAPSG